MKGLESAGCANSTQWQGEGLERTSQFSVQAVGHSTNTNLGFEQRLERLKTLVTESSEKLTAKVDQLAQEVRGVKMELRELGTATAVNKAGLEELRRGRAYERSPSPDRVFNKSRSRSTSLRGGIKCGGLDHYKLECPLMEKEKRVTFKESQVLNSTGLGERSYTQS